LAEEKKIKGNASRRDKKQRRSWKMRRQADAMLEEEKNLEEEKKRKHNWRIDNRRRFNRVAM
jgi:hypothetical protein